MNKLNKRIILWIVILLIIGILSGCKGKSPKVPENFDKDLWQDSIKIISILYTTIEKEDNFSVEDENKIEKYFNTYQNRNYNNLDETILISSIKEVYKNYNKFITAESLNYKTPVLKELVQEDKENFENSLLELKKIYKELTQ